MIPRWVDGFGGVPFVECGFSPEQGFHCWGLCWAVFFQQTGIALDRRGEISAADAVRATLGIHRAIKQTAIWRKVESGQAKAMDFVLMQSDIEINGKLHRPRNHVGIMVSAIHVLHIQRGFETNCLELKHFSIQSRLPELYRHVSQQ